MAQRLYVYYKLAEAQLATTVLAVRQMQAGLRAAHPGLQAELLRRPELQDGQVTLMETYVGPLDATLEAAIHQAARALPQPRHSEHFSTLD